MVGSLFYLLLVIYISYCCFKYTLMFVFLNLVQKPKFLVGEYRVVYQILQKENTLIIIIAHRRNVYNFVKKRVDE